jgi:hypothetical protein
MFDNYHVISVKEFSNAAMDFIEFKRISFDAARLAGGTIAEFYDSSGTPNFFVAKISLERQSVYLLCTFDGTWAFSESFYPSRCELQFVDSDRIAEALNTNFGVVPLSRACLEDQFIKQKGMHESDIKYWKPKTLGEGIFNWWD